MKNEHIKRWLEELENPLLDIKRAQYLQERLSMVNQKDYYEAKKSITN